MTIPTNAEQAARTMLAALKMCRQAALATASDPATRLDAVVQFADAAIAQAEKAGITTGEDHE